MEEFNGEWEYEGYNYKRQMVSSRLSKRYIFDTPVERTDFIKILKLKNYSWRIYERNDGNERKCIYELFEVRVEDVPVGTYEDFPYLDMLYSDNHTAEDIIFSIKHDDTIDQYIKDILIGFNEIGIKTCSSCSGLVEDHIDDFPYDDISEPFIMFDDINDLKKVGDIIRDSVWSMDVRFLIGLEDFSLSFGGSTDEETIRAWDLLRDRIAKTKKYKR